MDIFRFWIRSAPGSYVATRGHARKLNRVPQVAHAVPLQEAAGLPEPQAAWDIGVSGSGSGHCRPPRYLVCCPWAPGMVDLSPCWHRLSRERLLQELPPAATCRQDQLSMPLEPVTSWLNWTDVQHLTCASKSASSSRIPCPPPCYPSQTGEGGGGGRTSRSPALTRAAEFQARLSGLHPKYS